MCYLAVVVLGVESLWMGEVDGSSQGVYLGLGLTICFCFYFCIYSG